MMRGASGCKHMVYKTTKNGHRAEKTKDSFFCFSSGKFLGHFSKTAAPLHPNLIFSFNYNKLIRVQTWVQSGCKGCKLGANLGGCFRLSPRNNIVKSIDCQTGCKGALQNVPCHHGDKGESDRVGMAPGQLAGKNSPRMTLLEMVCNNPERRTAKGIERPCSFSLLSSVLHVVWNRRKDGIPLPHIVIDCAVTNGGVYGMMRDSGRVIL